MKERVLIKYQFQNDPHDKTWNCFFILKDSSQTLSVLDVLSHFPGFKTREYNEKGFHFRFLDKLGKVNCWVDIKNLSAAVPVNKQTVDMRVLILPRQSDSTIFCNIVKDMAKREAKLTQFREAELQRARDTLNKQQKSAQNQESTQRQQTQTKKRTSPEIDLIGGDEFESFDTPQGFDISRGPLNGKQSNRQANNDGEDFDILGGHDHIQEEEVSSPERQEQRMNDMFGADFEYDPKATNKVLDVIYIKQKKNQAAEDNITLIDDRARKAQEMQDAKLEAGLSLEPKIKQWAMASHGEKNNIRILLTTLHLITWEGCDWNAISMADLVTDNNVKRQYMKAITKVHPDHNSDMTNPSVIYMMDRIFNILNDSYTDFTKQKK